MFSFYFHLNFLKYVHVRFKKTVFNHDQTGGLYTKTIRLVSELNKSAVKENKPLNMQHCS